VLSPRAPSPPATSALSLHDALPISATARRARLRARLGSRSRCEGPGRLSTVRSPLDPTLPGGRPSRLGEPLVAAAPLSLPDSGRQRGNDRGEAWRRVVGPGLDRCRARGAGSDGVPGPAPPRRALPAGV